MDAPARNANPVRAALRDLEDGLGAIHDIELTILMPCLNEAETLGRCVDKATAFLRRSGIRGEIVIADNGSTDGSQAIARNRGARVVAIPQRGYGAALAGGIAAARGRYVIMGDSDDSYDFSDLDAFVEKLRDGHALVMGNRFQGGIARRAMPPLHRYLGNPVLSFAGRLFFRAPVADFHCGLRGFSREAIVALNLDAPGMEFASEMVVKASITGLSMAEVPTRLAPDGRSRPPHLRSWRDGWRHLKLLLTFAPDWLFLFPGVALAAIGLLLAAMLAPGPLDLGIATLDVATLIFAVSASLIGVQMMAFFAVAKTYAIAQGMLPASPRFGRMAARLTVDRLCLAGGVAFALGLLLGSTAVLRWTAAGFGDLEASVIVRIAAFSTLGMAIGIQGVTTGFLLGLVRGRRRPAVADDFATAAEETRQPERRSDAA